MKTLVRAVRKVLRYVPFKLNSRLFHSKRGRPPGSGFKRFKHVWLSKTDYVLLGTWAKERGTAIQGMEHVIVMQYMECADGHHKDEIKRLTSERDLLYSTLADYIRKFGKLTPVVDKKTKTPVNQ